MCTHAMSSLYASVDLLAQVGASNFGAFCMKTLLASTHNDAMGGTMPRLLTLTSPIALADH
ncbi:MAG: hypothetical protein NVS9B15_13440 [Acidobacteriaceae bacterium]